MKRWFEDFNPAQRMAFKDFKAGFKAYSKKLKFPEATNEGDYSAYFWAGFEAARVVANLSEKENPNWNSDNWVLEYDEPQVTIKGRYSERWLKRMGG